MVNPSLLLVLLQNPDSSLSLGFKPVFSVLTFQFNQAGHVWRFCMTGCKPSRVSLVQEDLASHQSLAQKELEIESS